MLQDYPSSSASKQIAIAEQTQKHMDNGVRNAEQDREKKKSMLVDDFQTLDDTFEIYSKVDNSVARPNNEPGQSACIDGNTSNSVAIAQCNAIGRWSINTRDDHCEMGHGSDDEIGPFVDAIEDE